MAKYRPIGQLLFDENIIRKDDLERCLQKQKETNLPIGEILISEGLADEKDVLQALARQLGLEYVEIKNLVIPDEATAFISEEFAKRYQVLPIDYQDGVLTVATADPQNISVIDDLYMLTNAEIKVVIASKKDIEWGINRYYLPQEKLKQLSVKENPNERERNEAEDAGAPTISLVHSIINKAVAMRASDIHIEPHEKEVIIRFRIDGVLYDIMTIPSDLQASIVSRLKIMANLMITEKRKPQDGGFHIDIDGRHLDVRMSTIRTLFGEKVVLRLLAKENLINLDQLGFAPEQLKKVQKILQTPYGLILVTGPTGSGKTTTLYAMLQELNQLDKNIVTIEDPVEYVLPRINQMQIQPKIGVTFAAGLRSILRQDPDIIMIGEIRDAETAKIAVQAALTGHLVLSTLHTNTAIGILHRLLNMGIEPYLLASVLQGIISQRLVRRICSHCKEEVDQQQYRYISHLFPETPRSFYQGKGCFHCQNSGYFGRIAVQETILVDDPLRSLIERREAEEKMRQLISNDKTWKSLMADGMEKVSQGLTTVAEILRVAGPQSVAT